MKLIFQIELSTTLCWLCYYLKIRNWYLLLIHLWRPFYDMHMKWCNIYVYKCNQRSKTNNLTHLLYHLNRYLNLTPMWPLSHNSTKLISKVCQTIYFRDQQTKSYNLIYYSTMLTHFESFSLRELWPLISQNAQLLWFCIIRIWNEDVIVI